MKHSFGTKKNSNECAVLRVNRTATELLHCLLLRSFTGMQLGAFRQRFLVVFPEDLLNVTQLHQVLLDLLNNADLLVTQGHQAAVELRLVLVNLLDSSNHYW